MSGLVAYQEALTSARHFIMYGSERLAQQYIIDNLVFYDYTITSDACLYGILGALKALDAYLSFQNFSPLPQTIEEYRTAVERYPIRRAVLPRLTIVYQNLHILGYQNNGVDIHALRSGFKSALELIEIIERSISPIETSH